MQTYYILTLNPGSTSTKLALYENDKEIFKETISYTREQTKVFAKMKDQMDMRREGVRTFLEHMPIDKSQLSAVACRGGVIVPVKAGAYEVNDLLVERQLERPLAQHASNLAAPLGKEIADELGIKAYTYDGVSVNEMHPLGYPTGFKGIIRQSRGHNLNMRAMLREEAASLEKSPEDLNVIIAHMGGGITMGVFEKGRMIDALIDTEGPFAPERCGRVPLNPMTLYFAQHDVKASDLVKYIRGDSGTAKLLGTNSALEIERRIDAGDKMAAFIYEAMAYQVSKGIGELSTVLKGKVDRIVLTGAIANSKRFTGWVKDRVSYLAPVDVLPGDNELRSLALGCLRVLRGDEDAHTYTQEEDDWDITFKLEDVLDDFVPTILPLE